MSLVFGPNHTLDESRITWQPEPNVRGTWSILSVCVVTTSLCVWTAVHPNLPAIGQQYSQAWRKLYWVVIGLFAPELVAYAAWHQKRTVLRYHREIITCIGQKEERSCFRRLFQWCCFRETRANDSDKVRLSLTKGLKALISDARHMS